MNVLTKILMTGVFVAVSTTAGFASIVGGAVTGGYSFTNGGTFAQLDPSIGFSIGADNFNDLNLYAFNEDQNITITSAIVVDVEAGPVAGDVVASHYVGYDPAGTSPRRQIGYVDFDAAIYGIATRTATLVASDYLANTLVTYLSPTLRGLEWNDSVWIDLDNANRLWVDWRAGTPGDYVRVFTMESPLAAVPLPASGLLLLGVLGGLGLKRRRKA
ncbi:VPLPA-CTERM sorting domain-containing protein [Profundibacter sp.]